MKWTDGSTIGLRSVSTIPYLLFFGDILTRLCIHLTFDWFEAKFLLSNAIKQLNIRLNYHHCNVVRRLSLFRINETNWVSVVNKVSWTLERQQKQFVFRFESTLFSFQLLFNYFLNFLTTDLYRVKFYVRQKWGIFTVFLCIAENEVFRLKLLLLFWCLLLLFFWCLLSIWTLATTRSYIPELTISRS